LRAGIVQLAGPKTANPDISYGHFPPDICPPPVPRKFVHDSFQQDILSDIFPDKFPEKIPTDKPPGHCPHRWQLSVIQPSFHLFCYLAHYLFWRHVLD